MVQSSFVERDAKALKLATPKEEAVRVRLPTFRGGMNTDKAPIDIADGEVVHAHGLHIVAGQLVVDTGYNEFGGAYLGQAQFTQQIFYSDGSDDTILITTVTFYRYVAAVRQWQVVSYVANYATVGAYAQGVNVFTLNDASWATVGSLVGITLDDASQLITTVTAHSGNVITTADAVPSGRTVSNDAPVAQAPFWNGDASGLTQVVGVQFPANEWFIFSNGVDPIAYYFGGLVTFLGGLPANTTCEAMCVAHEQLLIGHTTENGTVHPMRVRASDQGDPENWTPGVGSTIAAIYDLVDTSDHIMQLKVLGPYVVLYRENTWMRGTYLGVLNFIWLWEYMIRDEGAFAQNAAVDAGAFHIVVGNSGIYEYNGGYEKKPIGDNIFQHFFSTSGTLNPQARRTLFTAYVKAFKEVWIFYPAGLDTFPRSMLRVELDKFAWFHREYPTSFVAAAPFVATVHRTWNTLVGPWNQQTWQWNSKLYVSNVPNVMLASQASSRVMTYDYAHLTDNGTSIDWFVVTKELGDEQTYTRWEEATLYAFGDGVLVEMSIDEVNAQEEGTWTALDTLDFGVDGSLQRVFIDVVSSRLQLRLSGSDPAFELRRVDVVGVTDSVW